MPKTPLRYPGGKSRAVDKIMPYIRDLDCGELCSPFLGGGSIELKCAEEGMIVHGYDLFQPLVWFWEALLSNPMKLAKSINAQRGQVTHYTTDETWGGEWEKKCSGKCKKTKTSDTYCNHHTQLLAIRNAGILGVGKVPFFWMRENANNSEGYSPAATHKASRRFNHAVGYYIVNRCSFSGSTTSGGWSWKASWARLTERAIASLEDFKVDNFTVQCADFKDSIAAHPDAALYLDPPYCLNKEKGNDGVNRETLYGSEGDLHKGFDHEGLANILKSREKWVLSYNDCEYIRELYDGYKIVETEWTYGMNASKESSEILIIG
jgi:site-specific DNA-adenine methylase